MDPPKAAPPAISRLQPHGATQRGGIPDRSCIVRPDRCHAHAGGDGSCRAAARSSGYSLHIPWVTSSAVIGIDRGASASELMHIRLTQNDRSGLLEPCHYRCIKIRFPLRKDFRSCCCSHSPGCQVVFYRERNSVKRAAVFSAFDLNLRCLGIGEGLVLS